MGDDRKRILSMLAEGKLTIDEAERLLQTIGIPKNESGVQKDLSVSNNKRDLKYLRVVVDSKQGDNVNVRVPVALMRAGLKFSALIPPQAYRKINEKMAENGVDLDINALLKDGDIEQIIESMADLNVDVNSAQGDIVKVFFE
jgi:hypothetical protein